jgi:hypothetical protein
MEGRFSFDSRIAILVTPLLVLFATACLTATALI